MGDMKKKEQLGLQILQNCRTELYYHFPYLDGAFASIHYKPDAEEKTIHTDGEVFFYNGEFLVRTYAKNPDMVVHGYLHMLLHCLYLHPWIEPGQDVNLDLWNLACDLSVEVMIRKTEVAEAEVLGERITEDRITEKKALADEVLTCLSERNLSVVEIYRMLQEGAFDPWGAKTDPQDQLFSDYLEELKKAVSFDDHDTWMEIGEEKRGRMLRKWKHISDYSGDRKSKSGVYGTQAGTELEVLDEYTRSRYDYRKFLKQFSVLREEVELDLESFDYIFYNLGLETYQDMPLIEPLEYKEVNKLEELVIAIDTSSSCSTEVVQQFLAETYQMLSQKENFFKQMKVYLIQCDTHIEDVVLIRSEEEWKEYSKKITIYGRGGTDFRPVFRHIAELQEKKEIRDLRALIYFTDGDGVFPKEKPSYETAFVFLKEKAKLDYVPEWAQILLI